MELTMSPPDSKFKTLAGSWMNGKESPSTFDTLHLRYAALHLEVGLAPVQGVHASTARDRDESLGSINAVSSPSRRQSARIKAICVLKLEPIFGNIAMFCQFYNPSSKLK